MTKYARPAVVVLLPVLVSLVTLGCGGTTPMDPELTCDTSAPAVTLTGGVQAVFDAKCKSCHGSGYTYGDYSDADRTFAATTNKVSYLAGPAAKLKVVDGNARSRANSSLWLKVLGGDAANRKGPNGEKTLGAMPNDGTVLTAEQKKLLKDWICSGGAR
jgi:hypothetical protein